MVLRSLFSGAHSTRAAAANTGSHGAGAPAIDVNARFTYSPTDAGYPVPSADDLLRPHDDLIRRIRLAYGADQETFNSDLMVAIRRYASYVSLLPATPDHYYASPGGLLQLGLEIAFYALQATDGQIFSGRSTITERRLLEPLWRHATFLAGLCSELHRTVSHVLVTDANGAAWPAYLAPLTDWLHARQSSRFFVRWMTPVQETRALGLFALPHIVPPETLQRLAQANAIVVPHMLASISGMPCYHDHNILDQLVRHAAALVIHRDLRVAADRTGKPQSGFHLERYLVDALRRLVLSDSAWAPNTDKSRVWYGQDGLYLVWPQAAADVINLLAADRLPGMPTSASAVLDILINAGIIAPHTPSQTAWTISPPQAKGPIDAVKLVSPAVLFAHLAHAPSPLPVDLLSPGTSPAPSADRHRPGQQLSLLDPAPESGGMRAEQSHAGNAPPTEADATRQAPADTALPAAAQAPAIPLRFQAPLRLNPALRVALTDIVDTLNGDRKPSCYSVRSGLFVPLTELQRRHIDPATAIRTLSELAILACDAPGHPKTVIHDIGGHKTPGIVISAQYLSGFSAADFDDAPAVTGASDAGSPL